MTKNIFYTIGGYGVGSLTGHFDTDYCLDVDETISAAEKIGFPLEEAVKISMQTLYGAAAYARESEYEPAVLRAMVTSKGGTTAEGIGVLEDFKFREIMENCVRAAYNRSKELSQLR